MFTLLSRRNFNEITVHALCAEALVSRATFYAHFNDKYDLLKYLLKDTRETIVKDVFKYEELEREVNQFIDKNKKLITNILKNANGETLELVREFMSSIVMLCVKRSIDDVSSPQHIILSSFFVGGLVNLLTWMVENNFPANVNMMSPYLYHMLQAVVNWDAAQAP